MLPFLCRALKQRCAWRPLASSVRSPLCTQADELIYEEDRQKLDIKGPDFYDREGQKRKYFYYVDLLVRFEAAGAMHTTCRIA